MGASCFFARDDQCGRYIERDDVHLRVAEHPAIERDEEGGVVKLDEPSALAQPALAFSGDAFSEGFGQHDKGDARYEIIHFCDPVFHKMALHILCGVVDEQEARVIEHQAEFLYKDFIDFKNHQTRVGSQSVEDIAGDDPIAGAQLDHGLSVFGVNFFGDPAA